MRIIKGVKMNYPNLDGASLICFDLETYDPLLKERGPGVFRRDGNILGVAIATSDGYSEYYNIAHKGSDQNIKFNKQYIKDLLGNGVDKVAANILYDLDWLENWWNIKVHGKLHDVQVAEPLLDEYAHSYSLDALAVKYLNQHKNEAGLTQFCTDNDLKLTKSITIKDWLYMMPYDVVAPYAKTDALLPIKILQQQLKLLEAEDLIGVYELEIGLLPMLLRMRKIGVRVDGTALENNIDEINNEIKTKEKLLWKLHGPFNYNSSPQVAKIFDILSIPYQRTAKGNPSITADYLETLDHPIAQQITEVKKAKKIRDTFLLGAFTTYNVNGRIHCQFFPLRTDANGTISGRYSSAKPNLQQIPSRYPLGYRLCRSIFIPEVDHDWAKIDFSQVEYRFIAHYAVGRGAQDIRNKYNDAPDTDYHEFIMALTGLDRKPAKSLNFGAAYFMGPATCAKQFHWSLEEATELLEVYHREVPFVITTRDKVVQVAKGRGYIKTVLNRRSRVSELMRENGKEYSMFNRLVQGSAADLMKSAMKNSWDAGLYDVLVPHLTVHDELDVSVPRTSTGTEAVQELKHIMETSIKIKVPIKADLDIGTNWYTAEGE